MVMRREGQVGVPLDSRLVDKDRVLRPRYRVLVDGHDGHGANPGGERRALALAFAAIRRSRTGIALLRGGGILVRNVRWLALERGRGVSWRGEERAYPDLRALAIGESSAMTHAGERTRERRFARADPDEVIEVHLERFDRPGTPLVLAMARDATEAVRAERREERARSEAVERERLRAVGDLASGVAHEINNVLHAMALRLASLRGRVEGPEGEAGLGALTRMVSEAAARVSRLQDVAGRSRPAAAPDQRAPAPGTVPEVSLRVLVVDDDRDVLEAAGLALEHLKQRVDLAPSGPEAIARFVAGERFDLVLCDIGMPQLDGWQVAREVHALAPRTRLFLVSGCAREIRPEDAQRAGVVGVLAKPLSLEALRGLLAPAPGPEPTPQRATGSTSSTLVRSSETCSISGEVGTS
jgi:CheY-like chemotaxis protein